MEQADRMIVVFMELQERRDRGEDAHDFLHLRIGDFRWINRDVIRAAGSTEGNTSSSSTVLFLNDTWKMEVHKESKLSPP
jgi:hypothetical protein